MISVIVPIYNVERYLCQCLDSILKQTYHDLEILLIDDGSSDRCGEICDEYIKKDTRIRVFHTKNNGLSAARNLGLQKANGEYIGFVDSDDWIEPDMFEILLRRLEELGADISACGVWREYLERRYDYGICNGFYVGIEAISALANELISNGVWNKLYKKTCWTGIYFPEGFYHEEYATIHKVVLKAHSVSSTAKHLYHYRMREGSIANTISMKNLMDYWIALYDRYIFLSSIPEIKMNQEIINSLEKKIAFAAVRTWRWIYCIPKEKRNYFFLNLVSTYVQKKFPLFGEKKWDFFLRLAIFFPHYTNEVSFAILYSFNRFFVFIKRIRQTPFPSG